MTTTFRAGQSLSASSLNTVAEGIRELENKNATDQNTAGTTTSTSFTATLTGGTACSTTFVAPDSGMVRIHLASNMVNSGSNNTFMGYEIREGAAVGSGTVVQAAAVPRYIAHTGTSAAQIGGSFICTGLTAGATYNVRQMFGVGAGTGTFADKTLSVEPLPNPNL